MGNQTGGDFLSAVSDFHLLLSLLTSDVAGLRPHLPALCEAVRECSRQGAEQWRRGDWWATVEQMILASGEGVSGGGRGQRWGQVNFKLKFQEGNVVVMTC